jgi:hypothetical protein
MSVSFQGLLRAEAIRWLAAGGLGYLSEQSLHSPLDRGMQ